MKKAHWKISLLIFLVSFTVYFSSENSGSSDAKWTIHTAMSIIKEGNTDLDEYKDIISKNFDYCIEIIDGHYYNLYPIGVPLIALPFVWVIDKCAGKILLFSEESFLGNIYSHDLDNALRYSFPRGIELFIATFIVALNAVIIYRILLIEEVRYPLISVFIFAFCTSSWSTASRALWQHGPSMLMLSLTLYLLLSAQKKPSLIYFAAIPLAFSFVVRPTNSLSIVILTAYVAIYYRRYLVRFILFGSFIAIPFLIYNYKIYHSLLSPYFRPSKIKITDTFFEALIGNLISPGRGLFFFTPVILLSIAGIIFKIKTGKFKGIDPFLLLIIVLHWLMISTIHQWWGGHQFGARYFTDVIPYFIYFMAPVPCEICNLEGKKKWLLSFLTLFLIMFSFFIHYEGATNRHTWIWNSHPDNIDTNPSRLWKWKDPQHLRGVYPPPTKE